MALHIDDLPAAIRRAKQELREKLPNYKAVFAEVESAMQEEAHRIAQLRDRGEPVIPEIAFADIVGNRVSAEQIALVKARGAAELPGSLRRSRSIDR